jgi:hypothetical protein
MADPKAPTPQPTPEPDEVDKILEETKARYGLTDAGISSTQVGLTQVKSAPKESIGVEPETDVRGMTGAVTRGLTVPAFQSLAGMTVGAVAGPPGMMAGAAVGPLAFGLGDLAIEGVNSYFGTDFETSRGAITKLLDSLGTPKPDTAAERITEAVTEGLSGAGGSAAAFKAAGEIPKIPERAGKIFRFMGEKPIEQTAIGGTAAAASSGAQEAGAGPGTSVLAGLGGAALVPLSRGGYRAIRPTQEMKEARALERLQGVYQRILPEEAQRKQVLSQLRLERARGDEDVRLMAGSITNNPAILALQRAAERSSQEVAELKARNIAGVGAKISRGLEEAGAQPSEAEMFFKTKLDDLEKQTNESAAALELEGNLESQKIINEAQKVISEQRKLAESGVIFAEDAYTKSQKAIDDAISQQKSQVTAVTKDTASKIAAPVIESQKDVAKQYANKLYAEIGDVEPFTQERTANEIESILSKIAEGKGGKKKIPALIEDIYANIKDENGNLKSKQLFEPLDFRSRLNDEIDKALRTGNNQDAFYLQRVKKSIDSELKDLEKVYPKIQRANKFYAEYADIFKEGASEEAFKQGVSETKALKEYIPSSAEVASEDELKRLRAAIEGHPEARIQNPNVVKKGFNAVDQWVYSQAIDKMGKSQTSASLKEWVRKNGSRIFKAFEGSESNAKQKIDDLISKFEGLEEAEKNAQNSLQQAKLNKVKTGEDTKLAEREALSISSAIEEQKRKAAQKILDDFRDQNIPSMNPASRFTDGNAQDVIGSIISKGEADNMNKLIQMVSEDTSGKALEGLKNSARRWIEESIRVKSKPTTTVGPLDAPLQIKNLKADMLAANELLTGDSRKALEVLFGKNSRELAALDRSRDVLDMINRDTTMTASELLKMDVKPDEIMDALISVGAIQVGNVKGYVVWKLIDTVRKLGKTSEADVKNIFENLLAKSLYDPEVAEVAYQPVTKENWWKTKRLARNLGIQVNAGDFGLEEEKTKQQ